MLSFGALALSFLGFALSLPSARAEVVMVWVNAHEKSDIIHDMSRQKARAFQRKYPGRLVYVETTERAAIARARAAGLTPGDSVGVLKIDAHGAWALEKDTMISMLATQGGALVLPLATPIFADSEMEQGSNMLFAEAFQPLMGRFTDAPLVVVNSCSFSPKSQELAMMVASRLMGALGLPPESKASLLFTHSYRHAEFTVPSALKMLNPVSIVRYRGIGRGISAMMQGMTLFMGILAIQDQSATVAAMAAASVLVMGGAVLAGNHAGNALFNDGHLARSTGEDGLALSPSKVNDAVIAALCAEALK